MKFSARDLRKLLLSPVISARSNFYYKIRTDLTQGVSKGRSHPSTRKNVRDERRRRFDIETLSTLVTRRPVGRSTMNGINTQPAIFIPLIVPSLYFAKYLGPCPTYRASVIYRSMSQRLRRRDTLDLSTLNGDVRRNDVVAGETAARPCSDEFCKTERSRLDASLAGGVIKCLLVNNAERSLTR